MGDFIDDFIQEYKRQPCLWQTNHSDFKNRKKRQEAYMKLIEVANKHNEAYNIERTKQKINNLRCAFRVQLKKYNEVKNNSKDGKEETYCPKRKYFESLMFLLSEETSVGESMEGNKIKASEKYNEIESRTRNKSLSRKKIDKELEAITFDLKDDLETDESYLTQSFEAEKENKSKSESLEENEEAFNLALIEEGENLSVCNTKEIDPDAFESIIEEDEQSNKETCSDFKINQKQTIPPTSKQNNKNNIADENIVMLQSSPITSNSLISTSSASASSMATRANFRQIQSKSILQNPKLTSLSQVKNNHKNTRIVQVRTMKAVPSNNIQANQSQSHVTQNQNISSNSQKRLSADLITHSTATINVSGISTVNTSKTSTTSPLTTQKALVPKVTTTTQQLTIRNTSHPNKTTSLSTGFTISSPQKCSTAEILNNSENLTSQTKKIKLDFDSSNLEKILSLACTKLKQEDNEDDFTVFGRMVTCKLKTMDTEQALIAQRLITEILFDGQMKLLQLPLQNSQKTITTSLPQIFTPITSLRHLNSNGQTFYISEMNGNNTNIDSGTIQFSTNSRNVGVSGSDC